MKKAIVLALWALVIVNLVTVLPTAMVMPLKIFGVLLVVAHIAEYFIFSEQIKAKGDSRMKSMLMTLVFGVVYIKG